MPAMQMPPDELAIARRAQERQDAERAVTAALLQDLRLADDIEIDPGKQFRDPRYRAIARAALDARQQGMARADVVAIRAALRATSESGNMLPTFWSDGQDLDRLLEDGLLSTQNFDWHCRRVRDFARADREAERLHGLSLALADTARSINESPRPTDALAEARVALRDAELEPEGDDEWPTLAERALELGRSGTIIESPFGTINAACRGGLRTGKVVVVGGAPGAGKTTQAVQLAVTWAKQGIVVGILAADEDAGGLLVRIGQQLGLEREQIEEGNPDALRTLSERCGVLPLILIDADDQVAAVEDASLATKRRARGAPSVLIVDSIQTVRALGTDDADGKRARVDAVMAALKRAAKRDGHLVLATCELNRGAYSSQDPEQRIDDLAAFKESGGVEYGATTLFVLRSVKGESNLVDVTMPKNRQGDKRTFRMALDGRRAMFVEIEKPTEDEQGARVMKALVSMKQRIVDTLKQTPEPIRSLNELCRRVKGKRTVIKSALDELTEQGRILYEGKQFRLVVPDDGNQFPEPGEPSETVPSFPVPAEGRRETGTARLGRGTRALLEMVPGTDRFPEPIDEDNEVED